MKSIALSALALLISSAYAKDCKLDQVLTKKQIKSLESAKKIDRIGLNRDLLGKDVYKVDIVRDEKNNKTVVILGEAHVKGPRSSIIGKKVVNSFNLRLLEGIPKAEADFISQNDPELDRALGWQRVLLQGMTFNFFGSTITAAQKDGITFLPGYGAVLLDKDIIARADTNTAADVLDLLPKFRSLTNEGISLPLEVGDFLTPSSDSSYILEARNVRMVNNIVTYIADERVKENTGLAIVGADHNKGMVELLLKEGYERCQF